MKRSRWDLPGALMSTLALTLAAAMTTPADGQQQQQQAGNVAIRQGFEAAWLRQPEARSASMRRDAALATERAAERWTPESPALELSGKSDRLTRNTGTREYEARLAVPIWLPNEQLSSQAAARAEQAAVEARGIAARWRLAAEVREAYWALRRARLDRMLAEQRSTFSRQLASDVARRVGAGDLARSDVHQADSAVAAAESAVAESGVALTQALQRWTSLTGLASPTGDALHAELAPRMTAVDASHPSLQDLRSRSEVARRQVNLAAVQTRANPELMLGLTRERDGSGERYANALNVGIRIPLGRQSRSDARQATAAAEQVEAETQVALEHERVQREVETARDRVAALAAMVAAAERRSRLASESRGFFEKSFRLGESDLPTRLRIEQDAVDAERQAMRSRIEWAAAVSQWRQALGLLPE